jgi:hypothetical protein
MKKFLLDWHMSSLILLLYFLLAVLWIPFKILHIFFGETFYRLFADFCNSCVKNNKNNQDIFK